MSRDLELVSISVSLMNAVASNGAATVALLEKDNVEALVQVRAMTDALTEVKTALRAVLEDGDDSRGN